VEELVGLGAGAALELGLYGPWQGRSVVFGEEDVDALGVDVFGVEK